MKLLKAVTFCLLATFSSYALELKFHCNQNIKFDSTLPLFTMNQDTILSANKMCGISMNTKENCNLNLINKNKEYLFAWRCDEAFGDLYFNADNSGYLEYRCQGEKVTSPYLHFSKSNCEIE